MKTPIEKLVKGSIIILISMILTRGLGFVKSIIFARMLGPTDLGVYGIVYSIQQTVITVAVFGIPLAITKYIAANSDSTDKIKKIYLTGLMLILVISVTISSIYYLSSSFVAAKIYSNVQISNYMNLSALSVIFMSYNAFNRAYFQGIHKIKEISLLDTSYSAIFLVMSIIFLYIFGLIGAFYAMILAALFISIKGTILLKKSNLNIFKFEIVFNQKIVKELLNFGFPIFLSSIIVIPTSLLGGTWLAVKYGYDQVGYLQVSLALQTMILFIPTAISTNIFPWFSSNSSENGQTYMRTKIPQLSRILFFMIGCIMIILIPLSGYFVTILYGDKYFSSVELMKWLLLDTLFISQMQVYNNYMMSISKNYAILKLDIITFLLMVPGLNIFINKYGAIGVVWTYILVHLIILLLYHKIVSRELGSGIHGCLFAYGFTAMTIYILIQICDAGIIQIMYAFLALLLYIRIYIKFIFNEEDLKTIRKMTHIISSEVYKNFCALTNSALLIFH